MYTQEQIRIANRTSRNSRAIGMKAITPLHVKKIALPTDTILDFGAGKAAAHTQVLCDEGFNTVAYEFGANASDLHDADALNRTYSIVFASNVLNVQQSEEMLRATLRQIADAVKDTGKAVMNFPKDPRKVNLSPMDVERILHEYFDRIEWVGNRSSAPLWVCHKAFTWMAMR